LSAADADSITAAFARDQLSEAGWSLALAAPAPNATVAPDQTQVATTAPEPESVVTEPVQTEEVTQPADEPVAAAAVEPAPQTQAAPASSAPPETLDQCRSNLAALSAQNGILFRSGAAVLAEGTERILASIADAINHCPDAAIDVAGHTDSDGEAAANLALSVARAEAVVTALINLGVGPERLYALGYGESQPIADNATAAGKAQNRRIVVSVRDGA
jgi:OOP family OmpA-OmpF porin